MLKEKKTRHDKWNWKEDISIKQLIFLINTSALSTKLSHNLRQIALLCLWINEYLKDENYRDWRTFEDMNSTIILNDKKCYGYSIRIRQVISNDFGNFNVCKVSSQTRRKRRISIQKFQINYLNTFYSMVMVMSWL